MPTAPPDAARARTKRPTWRELLAALEREQLVHTDGLTKAVAEQMGEAYLTAFIVNGSPGLSRKIAEKRVDVIVRAMVS